MKKTIKILLGIVLVFSSCSKENAPIPPEPKVIDKPDPKPEPENQVPNSFSLLTPEIDSTIVDRTPTFSWEQATDPDGDIVTYDLYLDTQENPSTLLAENLATTSFELNENLDFKTQYYWKVVAKDGIGASTEITQSLLITVPIKHLSRYNLGDEGGEIEIEYAQGKLTNFDNHSATYVSSSSKLERLRNLINNVKHDYQYTDSGRQHEVFVPYGEDNHRWTFEYDDRDRISSITQVYEIYGVTRPPSISVFKYNDTSSKYPNSIENNFEDGIVRYTLKWEGDNISEFLREEDLLLGDGFKFGGLVKIEYDDNINPYYPIISNQFGFDPIHVLTNSSTGLESLNFSIFKWQSFNNITSLEIFDDPNALEPVDGSRISYSYSDEYYPLSASLYIIEPNSTHQLNWSYLNE